MELYTYGRDFYPDAVIPLKVYTGLNVIPEVPWNSAYQIIFIEEGSGIISINDERFIIHTPAIYLLNETEKAVLEKSKDLKLHLIYFHPQIINNVFDFTYVREASREDVTNPQVQDLFWLNIFLLREGSYTHHYLLTPMIVKKLLFLQDCINEEFNNQSTGYWICRGRSYFLEILCLLSKIPTYKGPTIEVALDFSSDLFEDILLYIHTNYSKKLTLDHLVETFHLNRTSLNNLFRLNTGETVISYIIKLRIEISAMLLRDTGIPVGEIGYRVGYDDLTNFGRSFKKIVGCSPSQYRENNSWLLQLS